MVWNVSNKKCGWNARTATARKKATTSLWWASKKGFMSRMYASLVLSEKERPLAIIWSTFDTNTNARIASGFGCSAVRSTHTVCEPPHTRTFHAFHACVVCVACVPATPKPKGEKMAEQKKRRKMKPPTME